MPRPLGLNCSSCSCEDDWKCEPQICVFPTPSRFPIGSHQLDPEQQKIFRDVGQRMAQGSRLDIELRGYGKYEEGKRVLVLSERRAEALARELVRGGVPRSWMTLRAMGVAHDNPSAPPHVQIYIRDHELPRIDPPRPP